MELFHTSSSATKNGSNKKRSNDAGEEQNENNTGSSDQPFSTVPTNSRTSSSSTDANSSVKRCRTDTNRHDHEEARTFAELGLCDWLCQSTQAMGFHRPFDIQRACIPAILGGKDVMGCAETGSGKTAAFALPILHHLSQDPYGVFAIVLTPTRELAIQIAEQFGVLGAAMGVRVALVIGGMNMMKQGAELARRPHIVIATPGRLRHHLESADPPAVGRALYLVLDEADRLLAPGFSSELQVILNAMHPNRQTLLFSATMTASLSELEKLAANDTVRFDLTSSSWSSSSSSSIEEGDNSVGDDSSDNHQTSSSSGSGVQRMPSRLKQEFLFMPAQVKMCYLVGVLRNLLIADEATRAKIQDDDDHLGQRKGKNKNKHTDVGGIDLQSIVEEHQRSKGIHHQGQGLSQGKDKGKGSKRGRKGGASGDDGGGGGIPSSTDLSYSIIIFVATCQRCQQTTEVLLEMGVDCVPLHAMLPQSQRVSSLAKFKSHTARILVSTDVASRGLDIPAVDLVINLDLPKVVTDYVHRAGRTARAGRGGRVLSLVTQFDVSLVHAIEEYTMVKMIASEEVQDDQVVSLLNPVAKALRVAQLKLLEQGFDDKVEIFKQRKKKQRRQMLRKIAGSTTKGKTQGKD